MWSLAFLIDVAYDIFIYPNLLESFEVKPEDKDKADEDAPQQSGDWDAQAKSEDDRYSSYSRKRSYDDSRGYGYYEHREERR